MLFGGGHLQIMNELKYQTSIPPSCHAILNRGGLKQHKTYEDRINWARCYPNRRCEEWMSHFTGVVQLTENGEKYWADVWQRWGKQTGARQPALRLSAKEASSTRAWCWQLRKKPSRSIRYAGCLALTDTIELLVECWEDAVGEIGLRRLRIHLIADQRRAER
jgi:hypothetical protein